MDARRQLVAIRAVARIESVWIRDRGAIVRERAELAADVFRTVPGRVAGLEDQIAVRIVPGVALRDGAIGIRPWRAGANLIQVLPPRHFGDHLARPRQVVRTGAARCPVL